MPKQSWTPVFSTLAAALLLSSCAADTTAADGSAPETSAQGGPTEDVSTQDGPAAEAAAEDEPTADRSESAEVPSESTAGEVAAPGAGEPVPNPRGGQQIIIGPDGVEFLYISAEEDDGTEVHHLHCADDAALAEKARHNGGSQPAGWPQEWDGGSTMPDPLCHPDYLEIAEWEDLEAHTACWEGIETSTLGASGQSQEEIDKGLWQQSQARAAWEQNPEGGTCGEQWAENEGGEPED